MTDATVLRALTMTFGTHRSDWYLRGIRRAEQDGRIGYARENDGRFIVTDDYGHICPGDAARLSLRFTNTRPLSSIARQVVNLYRNDPDVRFLELGPGAGVACATMNRLLPDAKIDTISLTPLNPYLRFRCDNVYDHITPPFLDEKHGLSFCSSSSLPFVHNQYIGKFPREGDLPKTKYHFIYENHGPIFYSFHPHEGDESTELARTAISSAQSLLREDGTMLIMASDGSYRMEDMLESITTETDIIVICRRTTAWHSFPCIVAKNESPLATRLREHEKGSILKSQRVLRLESRTLEEIISRVCELT